MEAIEEPSPTITADGSVKVNASDEIMMDAEVIVETDVCNTSNGVAESEGVQLKNEEETKLVVETAVSEDVSDLVTKFEEDYQSVTESTETEVAEISAGVDNPDYSNETEESEIVTEIQEAVFHEVVNEGTLIVSEDTEESVVEESVFEVDGIVEESAGNITFETEIFIENNSADLEEEVHTSSYDEPDSSNILSELGQNIELSDVLRSSDVPESVENNNCEQEVFNKEELLDILEGKDIEQSRKLISDNFNEDSKKLEEHLAMQQLSRLKDSRRRNRMSPKKSEKKQPKRNTIVKETKVKVDEASSLQNVTKEAKTKVIETSASQNSSKEAKGKVIETNSSPNIIKVAKGKVIAASTLLNAANIAKGSILETSAVQNVQKGGKSKVIDPSTPLNAPKEAKGKVNEASTIQKITKEAKGIVTETNTLPNVPKASKVKVDEKPKKESIVNALVQDWSDDEAMEQDESATILIVSEDTQESAESLEAVVQEENKQTESQGDETEVNIADASVNDEPTPNNKNSDDTQPQRRLGRVIKKKVIFDPDNPDTFTKSKVHVKKEKDASSEKEQFAQSTPKRMKTDQPTLTPKIKSPVSKMQWKKPQPKNSKQSSKRLTEIDKLLMDEGAVNMICQLTPEARMGNKNMKSKAEYIKNIQSNTPDTKEMKFRERKSKLKYEEGDSKKLGSGKHRLSLGSSVKSPSVSEDFENHSADDSIIYRRHSSSSYSSPCMSPRRLSDVDGSSTNQSQTSTHMEVPVIEKSTSDIFMAEKTHRKDIMNKSDCLSIKEKLNSKLSLALNKRKHTGNKIEKPAKVKKIIAVEEISTDVTVNFDQKLAEICIRNAGSLFSIQIMKILENILNLVDSNNEITVTLITSECGTLCSGLDLKPILEDPKFAQDIADNSRSLMRTMEKHSKLILVGVEGKTQGFSMALSALSDVLLASETASFVFSDRPDSVLHPGAGVLASRGLPQNVLNDLIIFGRELSASEALSCGLVSRVIWPDRFQEQVRSIAKDIASQPYENIMLKKQMLGMKKIGLVATFRTSLEKERDLLVNYWTSAQGMELLRASLHAA